ncbi:MAG: hypothetical protein ACOZBV_09615 [Pseudomonadota bacterium]|jgi:hypothetical protein
MKKTALLILLFACGAAGADQYVRGHVRRDGTYVPPHYRTQPDSSRLNNYSTQGNVNPYTGQRGNEPLFEQPSYRPSAPAYPSYPANQQPYRGYR